MSCPYDRECYDYAYYNCGGECVFLPIFDDDCNIIGWKKCCDGCGDNEFCTEPMKDFNYFSDDDARRLAGVSTPCIPFEEGAGTDAKTVSALLPEKINGFLKVQMVSRPEKYDSTGLFLSGQNLTIQTSGWVVTFLRLPVRPSTGLFPSAGEAKILPSQLPTSSPVLSDKSLSAMVILPESGGANQYWVSVPESSRFPQSPYRFSLLLTSEWSVLFLRHPLAASKSRESDCGCS